MSLLNDDDWLSTAINQIMLAISMLETGERPYTWENRFRVEGALKFLEERKGEDAFRMADALVSDKPFPLSGTPPIFNTPAPTPTDFRMRLEKTQHATSGEAKANDISAEERAIALKARLLS